MLAQTEGYKHRPQQEVLSTFIDSICQNKAHGIVEAETGSGKTCAYLIPAVLKSIEEKNAPAVIATKTKLLQNQLFNKDSQTINKLFNNQLNVTVLKGKENYCDLKQIDSELRLALQPNYSNPIEWCAIMNWILTTKTGEAKLTASQFIRTILSTIKI